MENKEEKELNEVELWSKWKDKSKYLYSVDNELLGLSFSEYEIKDIMENIERMITDRLIKKEKNKEESIENEIDIKIRNIEFESKLSKYDKSSYLEKYKNDDLFIFLNYDDLSETGIIEIIFFKAKHIIDVINHILGDKNLFESFLINDLYTLDSNCPNVLLYKEVYSTPEDGHHYMAVLKDNINKNSKELGKFDEKTIEMVDNDESIIDEDKFISDRKKNLSTYSVKVIMLMM